MFFIARVAVAASFTLAAGAASGASLVGSFDDAVTLDLTTFASGDPIASSDAAFTALGIRSVTAEGFVSDFSPEFYNGGGFNAGPAIFAVGDPATLVVLEAGASVDFLTPTFTIDFFGDVTRFGLRFADTSSGFADPLLEFFNDGSLVDSFESFGNFDASNLFLLEASTGFDRVVVTADQSASFDGVGITDLTVERGEINVVPLPATVWLLLGGLGAMAILRRK